MTKKKSATYAHDIDNHNAEAEKKTEARIEVLKQNGSCLTCKETKKVRGWQLVCSLKNKVVKDYNYCEKWQAPK